MHGAPLRHELRLALRFFPVKPHPVILTMIAMTSMAGASAIGIPLGEAFADYLESIFGEVQSG